MYRLFFPLKGTELGWFFRKAKYHPLQEYLFEIFFFPQKERFSLKAKDQLMLYPPMMTFTAGKELRMIFPNHLCFYVKLGPSFIVRKTWKPARTGASCRATPTGVALWGPCGRCFEACHNQLLGSWGHYSPPLRW